MNRTERTVRANGIHLCVETFGDGAEPAILLIAGAASSLDWWEEEFCERLAAGHRFVIRYDNRDTGGSSSYEAGAPPYSQPDLGADAVGLLDNLGVTDAHVVGLSMGGGIAQRLAVDHPERVASLTLISTSPGGPGGPDNPDLPPMSEKVQAVFADPAPEPDWSDRATVVDYIVDGERPFAGSLGVEKGRVRALAERVYDRTDNIASSMTNHWILEKGEPVRPRLGSITAPTLVLGGTRRRRGGDRARRLHRGARACGETGDRHGRGRRVRRRCRGRDRLPRADRVPRAREPRGRGARGILMAAGRTTPSPVRLADDEWGVAGAASLP